MKTHLNADAVELYMDITNRANLTNKFTLSHPKLFKFLTPITLADGRSVNTDYSVILTDGSEKVKVREISNGYHLKSSDPVEDNMYVIAIIGHVYKDGSLADTVLFEFEDTDYFTNLINSMKNVNTDTPFIIN